MRQPLGSTERLKSSTRYGWISSRQPIDPAEVNNFWGIEAKEDPVVERLTYEKSVGAFYGVNEQEGPGQKAPEKQTREKAIRAFFGVAEQEPSKVKGRDEGSEAGNPTSGIWRDQ